MFFLLIRHPPWRLTDEENKFNIRFGRRAPEAVTFTPHSSLFQAKNRFRANGAETVTY